MTGQRLPTRTLTYWRIRLLLFCIAPAVLGGFFYYTAARLFTIWTFVWMSLFLLLCFVYYPMYYHFTAIRSVGCWCGSAAVLSIIRWMRCLCASSVYQAQSDPSSENHASGNTKAICCRRCGADFRYQLRGSAAAAGTVGKEDGGGAWRTRPRLNAFVLTPSTSSATSGGICLFC